jgi:hypothetical protein
MVKPHVGGHAATIVIKIYFVYTNKTAPLSRDGFGNNFGVEIICAYPRGSFR